MVLRAWNRSEYETKPFFYVQNNHCTSNLMPYLGLNNRNIVCSNKYQPLQIKFLKFYILLRRGRTSLLSETLFSMPRSFKLARMSWLSWQLIKRGNLDPWFAGSKSTLVNVLWHGSTLKLWGCLLNLCSDMACQLIFKAWFCYLKRKPRRSYETHSTKLMPI